MSKSDNYTNIFLAFAILLVLVFSTGVFAKHRLYNSFQYISPVPGSQYVSKETNIILKPGETLNIDHELLISAALIHGSFSGSHSFQPIISDDGKTIILKLEEPFEPGEEVTVYLDLNIRAIDNEFSDKGTFSFVISQNMSPSLIRMEQKEYQTKNTTYLNHGIKLRAENDIITDNGVSLPSDFPGLSILINENPDSGYIFLTSKTAVNPYDIGKYLLILDNNDPIFYKRFSTQPLDFKLQPNGLLTYNVGWENKFYAMDSTYTVVDSFQCSDDYYTNPHDFLMLDNGHVLLLARDPQVVDMSEIIDGGDPNAIVTGQVIQELDTLKNVVWQWRSWDHFEITDATWDVNLLAHVVDYVHANALELDFDGNLLLSSRHLDEITKIDRQTGNIIWRLGGENNQFTFANDSRQFSHQHDIRRLPNGNITMFDNGNLNTPNYSRAIEYQLDEENLIAYKVWEFRQTPDVAAALGGNAQRLPGGNTFIGWGSGQPDVTEVNDLGQKQLEMTFDVPNVSYRAFRFGWNGVAAVPYLVVEAGVNCLRSIHNKFGDSTIAKYYIYADTLPNPTTIIDSTSNTFIDLHELIDGLTYYIRVTAIDSQGVESRYSNEVSAIMTVSEIRYYLPGDANMANGAWPPAAIGSDVTYLVNFFRPLPSSSACLLDIFWCSADANGDCLVIGSDVTRLVKYLLGQTDLSWCPAYEPAWPTPDDLPEEAPGGWPNCQE